MITDLNSEMLAQAVEAVFVTMMDLEVTPGTTPWAFSKEHLTSMVHLSGIWNGTVLFECNRRQACRFAGLVLSMDPPDAVNEDVRDVMGELANVIGGNIKSALASGLSLSTPLVTDGNDYGIQVSGSEIQDRLAFDCSDGPFWVTLMAEAPSASLAG